MGIVRESRIENGLYGFKTDLLDQIRDGEVPEWIHNDHRPGEDNAKEYIKRIRERGKSNNRMATASLKVYPKSSNRSRAGYGTRSRKARPPKRIREKLLDYLDSHRHEHIIDDVLRPGEFYDGFHINIQFGPRGGVNNAYIYASYRD